MLLRLAKVTGFINQFDVVRIRDFPRNVSASGAVFCFAPSTRWKALTEVFGLKSCDAPSNRVHP